MEMDVVEDNTDSSFIKKKDNWNGRPSCSFGKSNSPLNSALMERINGQSVVPKNTKNHDFNSEEMRTNDTILVNLEIGDKIFENIPIKSGCLLQDLAEEFAENEAIQVAYFLNERIKKGGELCDVNDAQVLIKLRSNWKWIPIDDLLDDLTLTVEEAFPGIQDNFQITFSLTPRSQRSHLSQAETPESPIPCNSNEVHEELNSKSPQEMLKNCSCSISNVQEIKHLLNRLNTLVASHFHDPSIPQQFKPIQENKQTQTPENEQLNSVSRSMGVLPLHSSCQLEKTVNYTSDSRNYTRLVKTRSEGTSDTERYKLSSQSSKNTEIHFSLEESSPKTTEPTPHFIEQLANDLPTQAFNDSIQMDSVQEDHVKSSGDETTPLSRVRVQFDRTFETPLLKLWFQENPVPSKRMISNYVDELNSSEIRKGKNPVTYRAVYIWFKNTRARSLRKKSSAKTEPN
ncbi:hypothetical protein AC249_AIPGENE3131 [Exaiptasia diaphana]|nr:hypothetical protein AC249_AIPGENE3131 [Exaiptasia diaphana]